jgi:regulator of sirC expression with transglutaminase-like and TPR domain
MLDTLAQDEVLRRLQRHVARDLRGLADLESPLFLLGRLDRPELDSRPYIKAMDAMAQEIRRRTSHLQDDLRRGRILVQYLGEELHYRGDLEAYTQPDNLFLHRVIERRLGLPLSLCALYAFVARRCGLRTGIVPLPGHVMLRLYGDRQNLIVDPFHGGEPRSQEELLEYLRKHGLVFNPIWMHDAGPRQLLRRQIANLQNSLRSAGREARARRLAPLLAQLTD